MYATVPSTTPVAVANSTGLVNVSSVVSTRGANTFAIPPTLSESDPAEADRIGIEAGHLPPDIDQEIAVRTLESYVWTNTGRIEQDLEQYFEMLIDAGRIEADATPRELVERVYRGSE